MKKLVVVKLQTYVQLCFFFFLLAVFLYLFTLCSLRNSTTRQVLRHTVKKAAGFCCAFRVLSRPEPNEMSGHHASPVERQGAHNSNQPECTAIKCIPRVTKAFSKLGLLLHCTLKDVTHLFNSSSAVPADSQ